MSDRFDAGMRGAFRRTEPPAGFAERVIARAERKRFRPSWALVAVAAMLLMAFLANREAEARRAQEAREQATLALRIAAEKLNVVRGKMLARQARVAETENP
jgi:hypothetical protein